MSQTIHVSDFPELVSQWDYESNGDLNPEKVTYKSNRKVSWVCEKGHKWDAVVSARQRGNGCPYCSGRKRIPGVNDLATLHPDIATQWDHAKNGKLSPNEMSPSSHKKVWWICDKGHSYHARIDNRVNLGRGCPYCSKRKPVINEDSQSSADVFRQWDSEKNRTTKLSDLSPGSGKIAWWKCEKGHSWKAPVRYRFDGYGCPYCTRQKVTVGDNDLATLRPDLACEWDAEKNDLTPEDVTCGSGKKVWWICSNDHSWRAMVKKRVVGQGCPYCSGRKVLVGFNDLATVHPHLVSQWDVSENKNISPSDVTSGSDIAVWWVCDKGHSWKARINGRSRGIGCPHCTYRISQSEQEIFDFVSSLLGEKRAVQSDRSVLDGKELDIYIPDLCIAIEFNGLYWHTEFHGKDKNYHYNKWKQCADQGIQLITIWEDEWRDKQEIVKSMLAHKLGVGGDTRVFARKTSVSEVPINQAREFFDQYHIQGFVTSSAYIGLLNDQDDLIALSSWKKNKDILYLDRYATSCTVVGGMGKLLKQGKKYARDHGCLEIVTFSDHQVSSGNLYKQLGFTKDKDINPDYRYLVDGERKHKFGYRLKRFRNDPELIYVEGMTERELAILNGLERIWDCGKTRWVIKVE